MQDVDRVVDGYQIQLVRKDDKTSHTYRVVAAVSGNNEPRPPEEGASKRGDEPPETPSDHTRIDDEDTF